MREGHIISGNGKIKAHKNLTFAAKQHLYAGLFKSLAYFQQAETVDFTGFVALNTFVIAAKTQGIDKTHDF